MREFSKSISAIAGALLCISVAIVACDDDDDDDLGIGDGDGGQVTLTGQQIIGVLEAVDNGEIELGQLAAARAQNQTVVVFAQRMVVEHSAALERMQTPDADLVVGEESAISTALEASVAAERAALESIEASATFDLRYMCGQVRIHRTALETIENQLMPQAQDQTVAAEVEAHRSIVEAHLEQAREIVRALSGQEPTVACPDLGGA